ncbi:hypothetical protein EIP91_005259 [Steccherinum ochraceum]|uniref:Cytochrome P450 n=1 Tax=Steccherinum ochraceum TaxID=92696 RepID=A0A4R0RW09_9APHY|nr:hypothetical protein EIP91_005259 [Steccherinum ochraceum]
MLRKSLPSTSPPWHPSLTHFDLQMLLDAVFGTRPPAWLGAFDTRDWALTIIAFVALWIVHIRRTRIALPPGPKGLPIIGNVLQLPRDKEWLQYDDWGKEYGPIFHLSLPLGEKLIVINSHKVAIDILEKNANAFAARPTNMVMATDLIGWGRAVALHPGGEKHRKYRRLLSKVLNSTAVRKFRPLEQRAAEAFLQELYRTPDDFIKHIRDSVGSMIVELSYGRDTKIGEAGFIDYAEYVHEIFTYAARSFAFVVDIVPILQHIPEWIPGVTWKKQATQWRKELDLMAQVPFDMVKSDMKGEAFSDSYVSVSLDGKKSAADDDHEADVKWTAVSLYTGGADTTIASLNALFLLMCLHPEAQSRAQKEIDAVVGPDRLPTAEDEPDLPFVGAIVKEILRYWTIAPLGLPHRAMEGTIYESYLIPKGSTIIANLWGMMHDPTVYSDPYEFKPERFLPVEQGGLGEPDPTPTIFGFGRRICPGMHLATASVWIYSACILASFNIKPVKNERGEDVMPVAETGPEMIRMPKPFKCQVVPRSSNTAALLGF